MTTYLAIAALAFSLLSIIISLRIAVFNYRLRGAELRHQLLRDIAAVQERLTLAELHLNRVKALSAGSIFENDLGKLDLPSIESLGKSLEDLDRDYRALPIHFAVGSHAAYQDKLLRLQRWVATFENHLTEIRALAETHGRIAH